MSINCPEGQNQFNFFTVFPNALNLIVKITLPSLTDNLVKIEVLHDIEFPSPTRVRVLDRGIFSEDFGTIVSEINGTIANNEEPVEVDATEVLGIFGLDDEPVAGINFCLSENLEDFVTFEATFDVRDLVCNINGQQAISASWFTFIGAGYDTVEIDFVIPIGEDGFEPGFRPDFTPALGRAVFEESENDLTLFLPYSQADIGFDVEDQNVDIFLFLGDNIFEDAPDCILLPQEDDLNLAAIITVALPLIACACLAVVVLTNKFTDVQTPTRQGVRSRLNFFPGNPDIIVAPNDGEANVVQAVLEEDDNQDLDAAVPVTTIDVRNDEGVEEENGTGEERNRFVTI